MVIVVAVGALLGLGIERVRRCVRCRASRTSRRCWRRSASSFVLDQLVQLAFSPDPRALPSELLDWRFQIGGGHDRRARPADRLHRHRQRRRCSSVSCASRELGWAVRATAQDRDAAQQMGVDVNAVNRAVFAIASGLGARERPAGRHVLQLHRPGDELPGDAEGRRRPGHRRHGQRARRHRRRRPARPRRELRHRPVRHELSQPLRLRPAGRHPGAAAQRIVRRPAPGAARADDRHLHRARASRSTCPRRRCSRWRSRWPCCRSSCRIPMSCRSSPTPGSTPCWASA